MISSTEENEKLNEGVEDELSATSSLDPNCVDSGDADCLVDENGYVGNFITKRKTTYVLDIIVNNNLTKKIKIIPFLPPFISPTLSLAKV